MRLQFTRRWVVLLATMLALAGPARGGETDGPQAPVALAWGPDGLLRVALRDARQVATVDIARGAVVARRGVPFRPVSLAALADPPALLVGGLDGEYVALDGDQVVMSGSAGRGPTRVAPLPGGRAAVAATWDESVVVLDLAGRRVVGRTVVPFPVGAVVGRPDGRLVLADAFGGGLAAIDPGTGRVSVRVLDGVNLRAAGLSRDGNELLIAHMFQYDSVPLTTANVDWGLVLSSRLSAVRLAELDADGREGTAVARRRLTLDGSRHGAADPSALAVSPDGSVVLVALSGAHQVLKADRRRPGATAGAYPLGASMGLETAEVGQSPADVVFDPTGETAVTADSMSDTLTVVRVGDLSVAATVRLGSSPPVRTPAQRGEAAFLDGRLSMDRWMSCASCHPGGHTHGLNVDTLGDGGYGAAKNTPSLRGVGPTAPFAWTGRFPTLGEQVHQSLQTSLRGPTSDAGTVADLAAFLQSLDPPPPRRSPDDPAARRGAQTFADRGCQSCHKPPSYTSAGVRNVGLGDGPGGHTAFNPPSLRGVGRSAPYFHDGSAPTLDAVLDTHPPHASPPLTALQRDDLRAFLESL